MFFDNTCWTLSMSAIPSNVYCRRLGNDIWWFISGAPLYSGFHWHKMTEDNSYFLCRLTWLKDSMHATKVIQKYGSIISYLLHDYLLCHTTFAQDKITLACICTSKGMLLFRYPEKPSGSILSKKLSFTLRELFLHHGIGGISDASFRRKG